MDHQFKYNGWFLITETDKRGFRESQRLAYSVVLDAAQELEVGMSEKQAANLLRRKLQERGVKDWLHVPLAWFGERSRFDQMRGYRDYLPSVRELRKEDVFILDCSPVLDGYLSDVGYVSSLEPNAELENAKRFLKDLRGKLPEFFKNSQRLGNVWIQTENEMKNAGYDNAYEKYPFSVLGHQVHRVPQRTGFGASVPFSMLSWFGFTAYRMFGTKGIGSQLLQKNSKKIRDGFWAIEPHLGAKGFGAKFEEILVVDQGEVYWLDDQVPHRLE